MERVDPRKVRSNGVLYNKNAEELLEDIESIKAVFGKSFHYSRIKESYNTDDLHVMYTIYEEKKEG